MTMNVENMRKLADYLEGSVSNSKFDMSNYFTVAHKAVNYVPSALTSALIDENAKCGTTACVAGWALALLGTDDEKRRVAHGQVSIPYAAAKILSLDFGDAGRLFFGVWHTQRLNSDFDILTATPAQAAAELRYLVDKAAGDR